MKPDREKGKEYVRMMNLSSVGIALILCTFIGFGVGYLIDKAAHTQPVFSIVFLILGVIAGFINVYRTITKNSD